MTRDVVDVLFGFRRKLFFHLLIACVAASLPAGFAAFFIETERLEETLVDQAALEARAVADLLTEGQERSSIERKLQSLLEEHTETTRNYFVLAEMYDAAQTAIAEVSLPAYTFVEAHFDRSRHRFPDPGDTWYTKTNIDGVPYLQVMVALTKADGAPVGWFEGIYRLAPETLHAIRIDIAQIVGLVVGAVLLTAAVLYPLMSLLQGHLVAAARNLLRANIDTLKVLGNAIAKRDSDTNAHNYRVTLYAVRIAEAIGLDESAIRSLIKGAFLHDVGKIAIPDAILLKPGKLNEAEFSEMKTHVLHGLDIISASDWLRDAACVVGGHHEKVDGSGYPRGLGGTDIPLAARIFAVADVFDALTSERPYKRPLPVDKAMAILEDGRDRHFDGKVLDAFHSVMPDIHQQILQCGDRDIEALSDQMLGQYFQI